MQGAPGSAEVLEIDVILPDDADFARQLDGIIALREACYRQRVGNTQREFTSLRDALDAQSRHVVVRHRAAGVVHALRLTPPGPRIFSAWTGGIWSPGPNAWKITRAATAAAFARQGLYTLGMALAALHAADHGAAKVALMVGEFLPQPLVAVLRRIGYEDAPARDFPPGEARVRGVDHGHVIECDAGYKQRVWLRPLELIPDPPRIRAVIGACEARLRSAGFQPEFSSRCALRT